LLYGILEEDQQHHKNVKKVCFVFKKKIREWMAVGLDKNFY